MGNEHQDQKPASNTPAPQQAPTPLPKPPEPSNVLFKSGREQPVETRLEKIEHGRVEKSEKK